MSDRLRDRIAAVVKLHDIETGECGCDPQDWWLHVADAVIAELGLEEEKTYGDMMTRYVTDWKADDE